jgi:uncharacterized protein (DUF983 family)
MSVGESRGALESGELTPAVTIRSVLVRSLCLRGPRCGKGRLFAGFFAIHPSCASCGLDFRQEPGYYVGAMYVNYLATAAVGVPAALLLMGRVPGPPLLAGLLAWAALFPPVFFRFARALWLGLDLCIRSRTTEPRAGR